MEIIQQIASVMTLIGMPTLFGLYVMLHKKHIELLKDRIQYLEKLRPTEALKDINDLKELHIKKIDEYQERQDIDKRQIEDLRQDVAKLEEIISNLEEYMSGAYYVS